ALARDQRRGDGAGIAWHVGADARIDNVADVVDERGVTQPCARRSGRVGFPDRAVGKADRADALEVKIAREIVAAGPQRLERGVEPRLERHEASHRWRTALRHRHAYALRQFVEAVSLDGMHFDDDAIGARALLAHLDPSGGRDAPGSTAQDRVNDECALEG